MTSPLIAQPARSSRWAASSSWAVNASSRPQEHSGGRLPMRHQPMKRSRVPVCCERPALVCPSIMLL